MKVISMTDMMMKAKITTATVTADLTRTTGCHPAAAMIMARDIRDFLAELNPGSSEKYEANLGTYLTRGSRRLTHLVRAAVASAPNKTVMIYHPALAYMGRDYGFEQVSFEDEGKSPSPARMKAAYRPCPG
ncbi:MAG: zinc ABC transporter substrate-binding protein [Marinilabiliales bacterium]|nr:zinc ABC transporter substrate-binding protein [Marinilabiliales bacterium]